MNIDVCMPTWNSADVLAGTLEKLAVSAANSPIEINTLIIVDNDSGDNSLEIARNKAENHSWDTILISDEIPLQTARKRAINNTTTEWFLFLDDDVRVSDGYLTVLYNSIAPTVGGIQGKKGEGCELDGQPDGSNSRWVRWRSHRAGTHASLIRKSAINSIEFPNDLTMLEDEYIRQHIENNGYLWLFNHQALFTHENQERHPTGWREGYLAGKYGLVSFCKYARKIPIAIITKRNPYPEIMRTSGLAVGYISRKIRT